MTRNVGSFLKGMGFVAAVVGVSSTGYAQGLLPEDPAFLATLPQAPVYRAWLPPSVDLSADFPPPGNQGQLGSCTGWAVGYALRSYIEHQTKGVNLAVRGNRFNPLFIYNHIAQSCSSGARMTDAVGFLSSVGALPFREMSSVDCPDDAGPGAIQRAADYRIGRYHIVPHQRPDDVKGELVHHRPVVVGIHDTKALHRLQAGDIYTSPTERVGSHALVVVGYDDGRNAFKVMNSWGPGWADGGFGWIDYATFADQVEIGLSVDPSPETIPQPTPAPVVVAPPPQPVPLPPDPAVALRARLHTLAASLPCSRLEVAAGGGRVSGFVSTEADLGRVRQASGGASVEGVALRPWPQCEALLTLDQPIAHADGLSLALDAPAQHCPGGTLCGGDALAAAVHMPRRPAHLYVIYIQTAGDTLILEQPRADVETPHRPGDVVVLGKGPGQPDFRVSGPYGREMVIALASASPLFGTKLPDQMTEREFLTELRKALIYKPHASDPDRVVAAVVLPIVTSAR